MATSNQNKSEMKTALRKIASSIQVELYSKLSVAMQIPEEVYQEFDTAELYFIDQLLNDTLRPWHIANYLRILEYNSNAEEFEDFAATNNFVRDERPQIDINSSENEKAIMQMIKALKQELTKNELLAIRETPNKTFVTIFADLLDRNYLTPSLEKLKHKLQQVDREDLAALVAEHAQTISSMDPIKFKGIVRMCLATLDNNIAEILNGLRDSLSKQYSYFQSLSEQTFSLKQEFIPLTFTKEVDEETEPVTEGSDAELQMLIKHGANRKKKQTSYIDAHKEIYSESMDGALISLIGHPGTGKTFYCKNIVNDFINQENRSYRFILSIACRDSRWHALEEKCIANPEELSAMMKKFLQIVITTFSYSEELMSIVLRTDGNGLLLIIDSFDEFPKRFDFSATLLCSILKRHILSKSTILITSRPGAWNQLLRDYGSDLHLNQSWQLLGFSPDQRNQFITTILTTDKAITCQTFLQNHPELDILCLVPVNISLLTGLVDSTALLAKNRTLTDMYMNLVLFTLDNELKRNDKQSPTITSLNDLPAEMMAQFITLAEVAYQGLIKRQITFSPKEFPEIETLGHKYTKGLGLFHIIPVITPQLTTINYLRCPHLTIQEFLSAWHLSQKSTTKIVSIVQQIFADDTWSAMKVCVRFLCGILTEGHSTIISIITDNIHRTCAPLFNCKYLLNCYTIIHVSNTDIHLSILPYVLETQQPSIITSYYKLLCPANSTIPHFYLGYNITPVETYSLTQYFSQLPHNSTISVLYIPLPLLNSIQLDMLADSINYISIDKLLVISYVLTTAEFCKQVPIFIEDIKYEIQQLHVNADSYMPTLLAEFNRMRITANVYDIYALPLTLATLKLPITISDSIIQSNISNSLKLSSFIRNIATSVHPPKHVHYKFIKVSFMDDIIINTLTASNTTFVELFRCYYTTQILTRLVTSLHNLEYLYIDFDKSLNQQHINAEPFQILKERNMKGLYLDDVILQDDSILYEYLQSQTTLQELRLSHITYCTLDTLQAIQHLTSLQYLDISANDRALEEQIATTEESSSAYLTILYKNRHTLSYADFSLYHNYFLTARYADIMQTLSQCSNLQCISFSHCLTQRHMQALATTINQLHALLYIDMSYNRDIRKKGIITLTDTLATNNTVLWIDLSHCGLFSTPVITSLKNKFPSLHKIDLESDEEDNDDRNDEDNDEDNDDNNDEDNDEDNDDNNDDSNNEDNDDSNDEDNDDSNNEDNYELA